MQSKATNTTKQPNHPSPRVTKYNQTNKPTSQTKQLNHKSNRKQHPQTTKQPSKPIIINNTPKLANQIKIKHKTTHKQQQRAKNNKTKFTTNNKTTKTNKKKQQYHKPVTSIVKPAINLKQPTKKNQHNNTTYLNNQQ